MGQNVEIKDTVAMGEILIVDTDRSFTGQDGQTITPDFEGDGVPAVLAGRLFALGLGIDHVFMLQNTITVRRPGGWDEDSADAVSDVTHRFLRYYDEEERARLIQVAMVLEPSVDVAHRFVGRSRGMA